MTKRNSPKPKLTARGIRLLTAAVFAATTVAVLVWGFWPVAITGAAIYVAKRAGIQKLVPSQRTALRGLGWGIAAIALLMAAQGAGGVAGGSALGAGLAVALGGYLYATRRTR